MNTSNPSNKKKLDRSSQVRDLLQRQNEMLGQSVLELDHFLYLHKSISRLHFEDIKEVLVEKLPYILSVRHFTLFLYDSNKRLLKLACHNHPNIPEDLTLKLNDSGVMKDALLQGRFILEPDFARSKYFKGKRNPLFRDSFLVCIPLMIENEIIGVVNLNDNEKGTFGAGDLDFVLNVVEFISLSISNALLHEKTKTLSVTDGLTQLYNHRQLQNILKSEFNRSRRYQSPLSLVMIDVDHFKKINDTYGHQIGDEVLVALANVIQRVCRSNDTAARYGGEEFVLLLPETSIQGAVYIAERIRKTFAEQNFQEDGNDFKVTISCGVAELNLDKMKTPAELIQAADRALYQAKDEGRDRTVQGNGNESAET